MTSPLLDVSDLRAFYGPVEAVHGVSLHVRPSQLVALLGPNGAGKTTTMRAVCGAVRMSGEIRFAGTDIARRKTSSVARLGIAHVPEGRGTFTDLSVHDNLRLALAVRSRKAASAAADDMDTIHGVFPRLRDLADRKAGQLSGGEQQMLALARALLTRPRLLLIDEPSTGLAPKLVAEMYAQLSELLRIWDTAVLIAEQNVEHALRLCDYAYVVASGRVVAQGPTSTLSDGNQLARAYLGEGALTTSTGS